jgi:hypothetical protein
MQRLIGQGLGTRGADAGRTFSTLHQLPSEAIGVQFELANLAIHVSVTYNAAYALSGGTGNWFSPINATGEADDTLWVPVTAGGSPDMTVAPAASETRPSRLVTDVMPFLTPPPVRTDGGAGICLFFRQCAITNTGTYHYFEGTVPDWIGFLNGQNPGQFSQTFGGTWGNGGNHCIGGNFHVPRQPGALCAFAVPHSVLPTIAGPSLTCMSVGDSILAGTSSRGQVDSGIDGVGLRLVKLWDRPGRPALHVNEARSGLVSSDFVANGSNTLGTLAPDLVLLQTFSRNDTGSPTQETVWTAYQRAMGFAAKAAAMGSKVIILSAPPCAGKGSPNPASVWEGPRIYANSLVKASGLPFLDSDALLGIGTDPVSFRPETTPDLVHLSDFGAGVLAAAAASLASAAYGIR